MTRNAETPRAESGASQEIHAVGADATVAQPTDNGKPIHALWACAETAWAMSDFPEYGSPAWEALDDSDPCKLAAMLSAAEKWRQL